MTQPEKPTFNQQYYFKTKPTLELLPQTPDFTVEQLKIYLKESREKEKNTIIYCPETKKSQSSFSNQANGFLAKTLGAREITFPERSFKSSLSTDSIQIFKSKNSEVIKQMFIQKRSKPNNIVCGFTPTESYFESEFCDKFLIKGSTISSKLNLALILPEGFDLSSDGLDDYLRSGLISTKYPKLTQMLLSKILKPRDRLGFEEGEICDVQFSRGFNAISKSENVIMISEQAGGNEGELVSGNAVAVFDIVGTGQTARANNLVITDYYLQLPGMLFLEAL